MIKIPKQLIPFCYLFILGTGLPMLLYPDFEATRVFFKGFRPDVILFIFSVFFILMSVVLYLLEYKKLAIVPFVLIPILLGSGNYYTAVDTSSKFHITKYLDKSFFDSTKIIGTIVRDPDERENYTNIVIKPEEIIPNPDDPEPERIKLSGKTGYIQAKLYPSIGEYYTLVFCGDKVEIISPVLLANKLTNPAGFDYRQYLRARNIYATTRPLRKTEEIKYLGTGKVLPIIKFSLKLKKRLLLTLRKTMPYPESAFLGGVSLGLRGGVPKKVKEEFQSTGVAHVLAVSGLHVGFVHILILMFCVTLRIPKKVTWFIIVLGLIVFMIITGSSPATQRAVLMSSIGQFFYTFGKFGVARSGRLTIPLAAFIILSLNPLMLPEASFSLSFAAVWSLVYITDPVQNLLNRNVFARTFFFFPLFIILALLTVVSLFSICAEVTLFKQLLPFMKNTSLQLKDIWPGWWQATLTMYIIGIVVYILYKMYLKRDPIDEISFGRLKFLKAAVAFASAQIAIQIGMMIPFSAVYFHRFPIAGFYANFLAIPLIGFIVQYTLISGLIYEILSLVGLPGLGMKIALLINAGNWPIAQAFLGMAKNWGNFIYYPYMPDFDLKLLGLYFIPVFMFIYWAGIKRKFYFLYYNVIYGQLLKTVFAKIAVLVCIVLMLTGAGFGILKLLPEKSFKVIFFDSGFSNSVLVVTPSNKAIIIDGGYSEGGWNFASSTISPTLSKNYATEVEVIVNTCIRPQNIGALDYIIKNFNVKKIISPVDPETFKTDIIYKDFLEKLGILSFIEAPNSNEAISTFLNWYKFRRAVAKRKCEILKPSDRSSTDRSPTKKEIVYEEIWKEKKILIETLGPIEPAFIGTQDDIGNNSLVVKISFGNLSFLIPTQLDRDAEWAFIDNYGSELKSTVMLVPKQGSPSSSTDEFISTVSPEIAICQYGYVAKTRRGSYYHYDNDLKGIETRYKEKGVEFLRTDKSGAIIITSLDGNNYKLSKTIQ